ncbi:DUF6879 family protein [Saccharopolyspora sp. 5N708]|uniref:DUF6879 family protein n=1 Tax=Saccharopolyspora sp. 5N708 TaxID=3457424 RepID=UPI003FD5CFEB
MSVDEYFEDFGQRFWATGREGCWKLERRQHFLEPDDESWQAFHGGAWSRALELLEHERPEVQAYEDRLARSGVEVRRVRVVELPISSYVIWELNALRIRQECGGRINVVGLDAVAEFEHDSELPEIFVLGTSVVYEVRYDEEGTLAGAVRSLDPAIAQHWANLAKTLYERGEPLTSFYHREVAGLRPPNAA